MLWEGVKYSESKLRQKYGAAGLWGISSLNCSAHIGTILYPYVCYGHFPGKELRKIMQEQAMQMTAEKRQN